MALSHFRHSTQSTVGSNPFEMKLEDISVEVMGLILNGPDYLYLGPMREFQEGVTRFHVIAA